MGNKRFEKAKELHPDVIVTDLSMPVMNGIEAGRILKKLTPTVPFDIQRVQ
jgi:CheY-like chemotaxis protein